MRSRATGADPGSHGRRRARTQNSPRTLFRQIEADNGGWLLHLLDRNSPRAAVQGQRCSLRISRLPPPGTRVTRQKLRIMNRINRVVLFPLAVLLLILAPGCSRKEP